MRLQISIFQGAYDNSIIVSFADHRHHVCWMGILVLLGVLHCSHTLWGMITLSNDDVICYYEMRCSIQYLC